MSALRRLLGAPLRWREDARFARLLANAGTLLSAQAASSLLGLASIALTGRALGPEGLGILAAIAAYVLMIDHFVNFQTWKGVIRYGAEMIEHGRLEDFKRVLKCAFVIDLVTAVLASGAALGGLALVMDWFGWPEESVWIVALFSLRVLFNLTGVPIGVLRVYNRFRLQAASQIAGAVVRVIGVGVAVWLDGDLMMFAIAWFVSDVVASGVVIAAGFSVLKARIPGSFRTARLRGIGRTFPGIIRFFLATSFATSVSLAVRQVDLLVIAAVLGPGPTGLYRVARQFAGVLSRIDQPLAHAIYPELSRLAAARDFGAFVTLGLRAGALATLLAGLVWLCYYALGAEVLSLTMGEEFDGSYGVMLWCVAAMAFSLGAFPLNSALLALGKAELTLFIALGASAVYLPVLFVSLDAFGLVGAGAALVIYYVLSVALHFHCVAQALSAAR